MQKCYCDICDEEMEFAFVRVEIGSKVSISRNLCAGCLRELRRWLVQFWGDDD